MSAKKHDKSRALELWGEELQHHRKRAGLTQEELGQRIGYSAAQVSYLEGGERRHKIELARQLDEVLGTTNQDLVRWHKRLVGYEVVPEHFRPWIEVEKEARALREFAPVLVPGLLQSESYALHVQRHDGDAVAARLARQEVLESVTGRYILDETVLNRPIGGPDVMVQQLNKIIELTESGTVKVLVVRPGAVPSVSGAFTLATLVDETLGFLEAETQGMVLTEREDVLALEDIFEELLVHAQSPNESLESMRKAAVQWTTT